jgi:hypothetical protein
MMTTLPSSQLLANYSDKQIDAITLMYRTAKQHLGTGGGNAAAQLLLGLYNGTRFPYDLTALRSFDSENLDAALTVLEMDARRTYCEVHALLDAFYNDTYSTGNEFERWAFDLKLKGRGKNYNLASAGRIRP